MRMDTSATDRPTHDRTRTAIQTRRIARQTSDELDGYAAEARNRGMFPGEQAAITWRRVELAKQVRT